MDYLILSIDKPGQEHIRDRLRPQRIAWLEANRKIIVAAGGIVDDRNRHVSGGLMIIKVSGREEAENLLKLIRSRTQAYMSLLKSYGGVVSSSILSGLRRKIPLKQTK